MTVFPNRPLNRFFISMADLFAVPEQARQASGLGRGGALQAPRRGAVRLDPSDEEGFREEITSFHERAHNALDALVAGNVQLLGFSEVKAYFGEKWESARQLAYGVIESCIERRLTETDIYVRVNEENYVILFGAITRKEAELRAQRIARDVTAALCDAVPGGPEITVRGLAMELDTALDGDKIESISDLERCIVRARDMAQREESDAFEALAGRLNVVWWPTTNLRKRLVSMYLGELIDAADAGDAASAIERAGNGADTGADDAAGPLGRARSGRGTGTLACRLDCHVLEKTVAAMSEMDAAHHKALIAVPVHFDTLAMRHHREAYMAIAQRLPGFANRRLAPLVMDLPAGTPQARLRQVLTTIQPFCLGTLVRAGPDFADWKSLETTGVFGLVLDGARYDPETGDVLKDLAEFVTQARQAPRGGFRTLLFGCSATAVGQAAVRAGVDYLNGRVISPAVEAPGRVMRVS